MRELPVAETTRTCLVCDAPLSSIQRHHRVVLCGSICRGMFCRQFPRKVCGLCGRPLRAGLCVGKNCRLKLAEQHVIEKEAREIKARESAAIRIQERALATDGSRDYPLAIIPSNPVSLVAVDPERLRSLADHIEAVLDTLTLVDGNESSHRLAKPASRSEAMLNLLGGACSLCGGDCCRHGGDRAYLDAPTFSRYQREHPDASPRDLLAAYLGKVGEMIYENSCIYHQKEGCSLPRGMRSDTCNHYFCDDLKKFEREVSETENPRAFFVAGSAGVVRAAGFVDVNGVREVVVAIETP